MGSWAQGANRARLELKVMKEPEDSQEPQDPSGCRQSIALIRRIHLNLDLTQHLHKVLFL